MAVLFPSRSTYWRDDVFHPVWKAAGLERLLPHDLRHTTATQLYDHDDKIEEIAKVLGDTVNTVEATYVHVFALRGRGDRMKAYDQRVATALLGAACSATRAGRDDRQARHPPSRKPRELSTLLAGPEAPGEGGDGRPDDVDRQVILPTTLSSWPAAGRCRARSVGTSGRDVGSA
jgi:hypothetical protein